MTDTPEQRVEEAARAIRAIFLRSAWGVPIGNDAMVLAAAALASSERVIAEQEARIEALESRWDGLAAKIALAMQRERDQTGLSYAAFAYAEAAMRTVLNESKEGRS